MNSTPKTNFLALGNQKSKIIMSELTSSMTLDMNTISMNLNGNKNGHHINP